MLTITVRVLNLSWSPIWIRTLSLESEEDEIEEGGEADEEENDKDPYAPLDKEKNQDDLEATKLDSEDLSGKPRKMH